MPEAKRPPKAPESGAKVTVRNPYNYHQAMTYPWSSIAQGERSAQNDGTIEKDSTRSRALHQPQKYQVKIEQHMPEHELAQRLSQ